MTPADYDVPELSVRGLPLPDKRLCGNGTASGFALAKLRRDARRWALLVTYGALGGLPPPAWVTGPVGLEYDVYRTRAWSARALDDDNFVHGMKPSRDGIADGLKTDDARWRTLVVRWHTTIGGSGSVTVTLRPLGRREADHGDHAVHAPGGGAEAPGGGGRAGAGDGAPGGEAGPGGGGGA